MNVGAPLRFEELLAALTKQRLLSPQDAQRFFTEQSVQTARLARELRIEQGLAPGAEKQIAGQISPVELLLAFSPSDPSGQQLTEDRVTEVFAKCWQLPYVKLDPLELDPEMVTSAFSKAFARKHNMIAVEQSDTTLTVATTNPSNHWGVEGIERAAGKRVELVIASRSDIQRLIKEFYGFRGSVKRAEQKLTEGVDLGNLEQFVRLKTEREIEASDQHVVHAVEYMLNYAFQLRASDIHVEPKRNDSVVRFRIDGTLHDVNRLPKVVHGAVVNRIKTLARLDIGEKRRPQDGRIKTEYQDKPVEIRVSTLAVAFGEKVVMRIFDPEMASGDLTQLGFFDRDLALFERLIARPHGIILVTGPTGSGKTTTLYTALRKLATDEVNVTTIEDPIEMVFDRINQTAINPGIGLGFAESLRTLLRQDPDIIMVGEIRDLETARHAIQASLTGHLVFATLHTNDAAGAVTRLMDLGAEHFLLASTLSGLVAQRLVKKVCEGCRVERDLEPHEIETISAALPDDHAGAVVSPFGTGCVDCRHAGYVGRSAIYELCEVTDPVKQLIMERADAGRVKAAARREGMLTLREAAVRKMLAGVTSYEQVVAVTQAD